MDAKEPRKQRLSGKTKVLLVALLIVCIGAGLIYIDTAYGTGRVKQFFVRFRTSEQTNQSENSGMLATIALDAGSAASFAVYDQAFLLCTKDGIKYYNSVNDQRWNDTFNMTAPTLIQEGPFVAVGDLNGKNLRVYDENGLLHSIQTEGTLMQFALNENGYLSMIEKNGDRYEIRIYNAKGTLLKGRIEETTGVYPISTDVSDDNRSFAVSYVDTTDVRLNGRVLFFYINPGDSESYTDSMYASVDDYADELVGGISYRSDGTLAVVSDKGIYGLQESNTVWKYQLENEIDFISFQNKNSIVVALGDSLAGMEGKEAGTVCWLNNSGRETASYLSNADVTYLFAGEDGVVVGNDRVYTGVRHTGREAWQYQATQDISDAIPMESFHHVLVVGQDAAWILDMNQYAAQSNSVSNSNPMESSTRDPEQTATEQTATEQPQLEQKEESLSEQTGATEPEEPSGQESGEEDAAGNTE